MNVNDVSIFCRHFSVLLNYSSKSIHINTGIYIYIMVYIYIYRYDVGSKSFWQDL